MVLITHNEDWEGPCRLNDSRLEKYELQESIPRFDGFPTFLFPGFIMSVMANVENDSTDDVPLEAVQLPEGEAATIEIGEENIEGDSAGVEAEPTSLPPEGVSEPNINPLELTEDVGENMACRRSIAEFCLRRSSFLSPSFQHRCILTRTQQIPSTLQTHPRPRSSPRSDPNSPVSPDNPTSSTPSSSLPSPVTPISRTNTKLSKASTRRSRKELGSWRGVRNSGKRV